MLKVNESFCHPEPPPFTDIGTKSNNSKLTSNFSFLKDVNEAKNLQERFGIKEKDDGSPFSLGELQSRVGAWDRISPTYCSDQLKPFERAVSTIVETTLNQFHPSKKEMLEVGSGGYPITTLMPNVSDEVKKKIHLSDVSTSVVNYLNENFPSFTVFTLNATNLSGQRPLESYQCVVMNSVLDTMIRPDIKKTCSEIFKILKPGGILIHFLSRKPFSMVTAHEYTNNDSIIFPYLSDRNIWDGLYIMEKSAFDKKINELEDSEEGSMKSNLLEYASLTPAEREDFCMQSSLNSRLENLNFLSRFVEISKIPVKKVNHTEFFSQIAEEELKATGYQLEYSKRMEASMIGQRNGSFQWKRKDKHLFCLYDGDYRASYLGVLAQGMVQEVAKFPVIVASKPCN